MKTLVERILDKRIFKVKNLEGFKSQGLEGTNSICECNDDGEDGCSE